MIFLTGKTIDLTTAVNPVIELIVSATNVLLGVFTAAMAVLAIVHSFTYAKAEDPQQKQIAKQKLTNLVISFGLAFALLVMFSLLKNVLIDWATGQGVRGLTK